MSDPSPNAELIERLRAQADEVDRFNEHLRKSGTPDDGLQRNWQREAVDEIERLRGCLKIAPGVVMIAYEDGAHQRVSRGYAKERCRAEKAESALAQARKDALLDAAKKAENPGFIEARDTEWDEGVNYAKRFVAAAIRALAEKVTG